MPYTIEPPSQDAPPPQQKRSPEEAGSTLEALWNGLLHGEGNIIKGGGQLAGHLGVPGMPTDQSMQARERALVANPTTRAHPTATAIGEAVGEAASPLALLGPLAGKGGSMLGRMATSAAGGALGGAAAPVTSGEDYWGAKKRQIVMGAGASAALGAASGFASPRTSPERQMLESRGVRLTPGQRMTAGQATTSTAQEAERTLQAFPIIKGWVTGNVRRSVDDFNRAGVRQALEPIGAVVPTNIKAGHSLMDFAKGQLDRAYDRVLPHINLARQPTEGALNGNPEFRQFISELSADDKGRLNTILQNRLFSRFGQQGAMDGQLFKRVEEDISKRATSFAGTKNSELGEGLKLALGIVRDELATQNPQFAGDLRRINESYAMFSRLRDASTRRATSKGVFTPADLLAAAKASDTSAGRGRFSRGDALLQALGEAGDKILSGSFYNGHERVKMGDWLKGAIEAGPYGALSLAQAAPGAISRHALGVAAPVAGEAIGRRVQAAPPRGYTIDQPDIGPQGGKVLGRTIRKPNEPQTGSPAEYIEPPPQ